MKSRRWNIKYIEYVSKRNSCLFTFHTAPQFFWHQGVSMKKNAVWDEGGLWAARSQITCTTCFLWVTWFYSAQVNKLLSDSLSFPNRCYLSAVANSVWGSHCCLAFLSKQIAARLLLYNTHSTKKKKSVSNPFRRLKSEQRFACSESDCGDVGTKIQYSVFIYISHSRVVNAASGGVRERL